MKLEENIYISKETGYMPIYNFIKQFSMLHTFAIFGDYDNRYDKVAFVDDGYRVKVVEAQSVEIMALLELWCKQACSVYIGGDTEDATVLMSIRDESMEGGFHLKIEGFDNDNEKIVYTLDELPVVPKDEE